MTRPRSEAAIERAPASEALDYDFDQVVRRYQDKLELSLEEAKELFEDTKKFLYLCGTNRDLRLSPTEALDKGWHEFLMYTKQYREFCNRYFGEVIHHVPRDPENPPTGPNGILLARKLAEENFGGLLSRNWDLPEKLQAALDAGGDIDSISADDPCGSCGGGSD